MIIFASKSYIDSTEVIHKTKHCITFLAHCLDNNNNNKWKPTSVTLENKKCSLILLVSWLLNRTHPIESTIQTTSLAAVLQELSPEHRGANSRSVGDEFDGHQGLNNASTREVWHIVTSNIESCLSFVEMDTATEIWGRVCAWDHKHLKCCVCVCVCVWKDVYIYKEWGSLRSPYSLFSHNN